MTSQVKNLKGAEYNPRKISKKQLEALKKSMAEYGDLSGIVFNKNTGNLIGGHQRVKVFNKAWPIKTRQTTIPANYIYPAR